MKKSIFKKILCILDSIEKEGVHFEKAIQLTHSALANESIAISIESLTRLFHLMDSLHFFRHVPCGIDLNPAATILSRSEPASAVEALSLFECLIAHPQYHDTYQQVDQKNPFLHEHDFMKFLPDPLFYHLLIDTVLYEVNQDSYRMNPLLVHDAYQIILEYDVDHPLVSTTLCALYTADIVNHEDQSVSYRNTSKEVIDYPYLDIITDIIPRMGIPIEREETKALQAFYKDTLFHEFEHCCPLCGIDFPQMLIASHIKPFRDCGHIYECCDYQNGLLLCRNHDYLFDQGYIAFQDDGKILISEELASKDNMETAYNIHTDDELAQPYLRETRKMFLQYHRNHIFKR